MATTTLMAIEDTYIREANPDNNYGNDTSLYVQSHELNNARTLVKFNIAAFIGKNITSAILNLRAFYSQPDMNYHRDHLTKRITGDWTEMSVTWNTRPAVTDVNSIVNHHDYTTAEETESYDVTNMLKDAINEGRSITGFMIQDNAENNSLMTMIQYYDRQRFAYPPQLVITYEEVVPQGTLEVHAFLDSLEVIASVEIVGVGTYLTPFTAILSTGTYTLKATYGGTTQTKTAVITENQKTVVNFNFAVSKGTLEVHAYRS